MYPHGELAHLAARKAALRRRIARTRQQCVSHAAGVARPLRWLDQAIAIWRQVQPVMGLAVVPIGFWVMRAFSRRHRVMGSLLRWGPLLLNVVRGFTARSGDAKAFSRRAA